MTHGIASKYYFKVSPQSIASIASDRPPYSPRVKLGMNPYVSFRVLAYEPYEVLDEP